MKTLVLLSALVLGAFLAQADPLPEATEDTTNEEQQGIEDQDVSTYFGDPEISALQDAAARNVTCHCRKKGCRRYEKVSGSCSVRFVFCCR